MLPALTGFKQPAAWRQDVDMVVAYEATGDSVFAVVKLQVPATVAQQQQWHKYAVASFLLATNGSSYFQFIGDAELTNDVLEVLRALLRRGPTAPAP